MSTTLGEPVDFAHSDGDFALFCMAAATDAKSARVSSRRIGLLDRTTVLDSDAAIQVRIESIFAGMLASPRPPPGAAEGADVGDRPDRSRWVSPRASRA